MVVVLFPEPNVSELHTAAVLMTTFLLSGIVTSSDDVGTPDGVQLPAVFHEPPDAPLEYDLNVAALAYTMFWIGAGYRSGDSWNILTGYQINNQLRLGYSYDYTITKLKNYAGGTHELSLNYLLQYKSKKVTSPRYF